jgi:cation transport regulator ChaC
MRTFVFGYGSLLRRADTMACHLLGHRRAWNVAMDNRRTIPGYKYYLDAGTGERPPLYVTFLNIYPAPEARLNGVVFPVDPEALPRLDERERNYVRVEVTDGLDVDVGGRVWAYVGRDEARERFEEGRRTHSAVVSERYFDGIREDFAAASGLDAFDRSTDDLTVPLRKLRRIDLPPPAPARR